jgi:hypothetical protein
LFTVLVYLEIDGIKAEVVSGLNAHLYERIIALAPYSLTGLWINEGIHDG